MTTVTLNDKFRLKVTDRCSFHCPFCHAEGGKGADNIQVNKDFLEIVALLRPLYSRVHLTGGEPFLYKDLEKVLAVLKGQRYKVSITTNGFFSMEGKEHVIEALEYVNVSLHSLKDGYLAKLAGRTMDAGEIKRVVIQNIETICKRLPVRINVVVSEDAVRQGVEEILEFACERNLEVKLVPEWSVRQKAMEQIETLLEEHHFQMVEKQYLLPGSNVRERYQNGRGQVVEVKKIELYQPEFLCGDCEKKDQCQEGFSFLRLGGSPLYVQLCIFEKKMGIKEFQTCALEEVYRMFENKNTFRL